MERQLSSFSTLYQTHKDDNVAWLANLYRAWLAHLFQISLAFSLSKILLLEWLPKNLGSVASHLFFLTCIGFRFATELVLKLLRLLLRCSNFSSHPILQLLSHDMYRPEHSALLYHCQYVFPREKPPRQTLNRFHLLLQTSGMHCQIICLSIPTLPAFRRALKHHLFLLAYPDSRAKSGKIKPAQCITLSDAAPTTAIAQPGNTMPPQL